MNYVADDERERGSGPYRVHPWGAIRQPATVTLASSHTRTSTAQGPTSWRLV